VIVSRQPLIDSNFSTVICAPVFSERHGLPSQVAVGAGEGLKHDSAILCDSLISIDKMRLTDFIGELSEAKVAELDAALTCALGLQRG
jgi:mRNA interferase MazF